MPVGYDKITFGDAGDTRLAIPLPWRRTSSDGRCTVTIDSSGPATEATWDDLWTATTALNAKCARATLKGGKAKGLGDNKKIKISITNGPEPRLSLAGAQNATAAQNSTGDSSDDSTATA